MKPARRAGRARRASMPVLSPSAAAAVSSALHSRRSLSLDPEPVVPEARQGLHARSSSIAAQAGLRPLISQVSCDWASGPDGHDRCRLLCITCMILDRAAPISSAFERLQFRSTPVLLQPTQSWG